MPTVVSEKLLDALTLAELDRAIAIAQGWVDTEINLGGYPARVWLKPDGESFSHYVNQYEPTRDQEQCGELIDEFKIRTEYCPVFSWMAGDVWEVVLGDTRLIAACKGYLSSVYGCRDCETGRWIVEVPLSD